MADRDKPRAHVIEQARSGGATCQTCELPISDGEWQLAEAFVVDEGRWARAHKHARTPRRSADPLGDDRSHNYLNSMNADVATRFHHIACAVRAQPYKLRSALAATTLEIPDRAKLEEAIERALSGADAAEEDPATRDEYASFLERLPDDDVVLVFGDWLQSVGDPRGELIAIQHALETATDADRARLADSERKLLATHRKRLVPDRDLGKLVWRRGFVDRLIITDDKSVEPLSLSRLFAHPSLRFVRELAIELPRPGYSNIAIVVAANLPRPLPPTLEAIELTAPARAGRVGDLGDVAALVGELPRLVRLALNGNVQVGELRHPKLATLELGAGVAGLARMTVTNLPSLRRVALHVDRGLDVAIAELAASRLYERIRELVLRGDLSAGGIATLTAARSLALLDVRGCTLAANDIARLDSVATVVETSTPPAPVEPGPIKEWLVRHKRRPEWGIGRVLAESDDGLEVEFETGGTKQIKNVELLEEIQ